MDDYEVYDKINTTAANWLRLYEKNTQMPLGIRNFGGKNKIHIWLLKMINIASIANGYTDYYIGCSLKDYIKFRFFKHFNHMKKLSKNYKGPMKVAFIDIPVFVDELCYACGCSYTDIENMFDGYWSD